jgi:hypothetical protein
VLSLLSHIQFSLIQESKVRPSSQGLCLSIAISDSYLEDQDYVSPLCVALGLVTDVAVYRLYFKPAALVLYKKVMNPHGGKAVSDLHFLSDGGNGGQELFSLSYGHNFRVVQLERHPLDEVFPLEDSSGDIVQQPPPSNIQAVCLTPGKFYLLQNNDLKINRRYDVRS